MRHANGDPPTSMTKKPGGLRFCCFVNAGSKGGMIPVTRSLDKGSKPINQKTIAAVLIAGAFVGILNQTLLITALPIIMHDMNVNPSQVQWLTTIFLLTNGIMIPITAFLISKFTTRQLYLAAMGLFAFGTFLAAVAPVFSALLVGRVIQAAGAGILIPLMQTIFLNIFPEEKRGSVMGFVGLVISFAPAIGPTLSGWIIGHGSWRLLFYIILPIALINIAFAWYSLKNITEQTNPKLDILSILLSTLGFGGMLYGFSVAGSDGWSSSQVMFSLIGGALALVLFIWRQLILSAPIMEFRVFKSPLFAISSAIGIVIFASLIGAETVLPIYVQDIRGFSALDSGLMLLPGAIMMGIMSPITGRIFDKVGARGLSITGLFLLTASTLPFSFLNDATPFWYMTVMFTIRMAGISMVMMPIMTAALNELNNRLIPHGTAMINTLNQIGGSIGTAVLITVFSTSSAASNASSSAAATHGVNSAFFVATVISFVGFVLSMFIKRKANTKEKTVQGVPKSSIN